jgi:integrase/recombinase XerD
VQGDRPMDMRNRALLAVLMHGLRAEDVAQLNVGNYNPKERLLCFLRKKGKNEATLPITQACAQAIDEYLDYRRGEGHLEAGSPLFLAVPPHPPERLGYSGIHRFVSKTIGGAIGLDTLTPHQFRHHYAAWLLSIGVDSTIARSLMGQKSAAVFERYIRGAEAQLGIEAFRRATGEAVTTQQS